MTVCSVFQRYRTSHLWDRTTWNWNMEHQILSEHAWENSAVWNETFRRAKIAYGFRKEVAILHTTKFPWISWRPFLGQPIDTKLFFDSPTSVLTAFDSLKACVLKTHPPMLEELKTRMRTNWGYFTGRASESNVKPTFTVNKCSAFDRRRLTEIIFKI